MRSRPHVAASGLRGVERDHAVGLDVGDRRVAAHLRRAPALSSFGREAVERARELALDLAAAARATLRFALSPPGLLLEHDDVLALDLLRRHGARRHRPNHQRARDQRERYRPRCSTFISLCDPAPDPVHPLPRAM